MAKEDYFPTDDRGRVALLMRFSTVIGPHAAQLGLDAADLAAQKADALWANYVLGRMEVVRREGKSWTRYKDTLFLEKGTSTVPADIPVPEVVPPEVQPGVFSRFRALVRRIKVAPGYSEATGRALGIIGPEPAPQDEETLAPELRLRSIGEQVVIVWKKDRKDGLRIEVDRGTGKWELLMLAMHPDTTDPEPFPAIPAKWRYRAMYFSKGRPQGQWSAVVEIVVGG